MSALWAVQEAVFAALDTGLVAPVYSLGNVPDNLATQYAVVGEATAEADDSDGRLGFSVVITVHSWDSDPDSHGFGRVKPLMNDVYTVLNRAALVVSGYTLTDSFFEFEQAMMDPDGLTAHGAQRFRVLLTTN